MQRMLALIACSCLLLFPGCGGSGGSPGTATVSVGITDNASGFDAVVLTIREVGIVASNTPTTYVNDADVAALPVTLDVLDFPAASVFHLADVEVPLPANGEPLCFHQVRFVLAEEGDSACTGPYCNYVIETGDTVPQPLNTPSGQQSGIKVLTPSRFCADAGQTAVQMTIDFDPVSAIVRNDRTGLFQLKPTGIRIIEGAWQVPPDDFIEGTVRIPVASDEFGCIPFATAPLVTVEGRAAGDPAALPVATASLADELTPDCFHVGRFKLLLPGPGLYDVSADWDVYSGVNVDVASGTADLDLLLTTP